MSRGLASPGGEWRWEGDVLIGTSTQSEQRHGLLISDWIAARCELPAASLR
jgi:hypothetical protein